MLEEKTQPISPDCTKGGCPQLTSAGGSLTEMIKAGFKKITANNHDQTNRNKMFSGGSSQTVVPQFSTVSGGTISAGGSSGNVSLIKIFQNKATATENSKYDQEAAHLKLNFISPFEGGYTKKKAVRKKSRKRRRKRYKSRTRYRYSRRIKRRNRKSRGRKSRRSAVRKKKRTKRKRRT